MSNLHQAYLSLGSNIEPEINLMHAIDLLQKLGRLEKISNAWESESIGAEGPNFLNACVLLVTSLGQIELKEQALLPIETELGRKRSANKFAPRTIDIDIVLFGDQSTNDKYWGQAFVVVPLAEIFPEFQNPLSGENIIQTAERLRQQVWMEPRSQVLIRFRRNLSP